MGRWSWLLALERLLRMTLVKEVAKHYYRCSKCDYRWSSYDPRISYCSRCGADAERWGVKIEFHKDDDPPDEVGGPSSMEGC